MVELFVNDLEQITMLEGALMNAKIEYTHRIDDGRYGITPPYLIVDGVPLDELRVLKWIGERE